MVHLLKSVLTGRPHQVAFQWRIGFAHRLKHHLDKHRFELLAHFLSGTGVVALSPGFKIAETSEIQMAFG